MQPVAGVNIPYHKTYYARNRLKIRAKLKAWAIANPAKVKSARKKYIESHKEKHLESKRRWTNQNYAKKRLLIREKWSAWTRGHKDAAYRKLGGKCSVCSESRTPVLSIDHVHGDGALHRSTMNRNRKKLYDSILEDTQGRFQILCMNCQWMKRHEQQEYKKKPAPISESGVMKQQT